MCHKNEIYCFSNFAQNCIKKEHRYALKNRGHETYFSISLKIKVKNSL